MKLDKSNKTYCPAPFFHVSQITSDSFMPCCNFDENAIKQKETTLSQYWQSSELEQIRQKMLSGQKVDGCFKCYESEQLSGSSQRTKYLKQVLPTDQRVLRSVELFLSNTCNFKCRMCSETRSTKWINDAKVIYPELDTEVFQLEYQNIFSNSIIDQDIEKVEILGGEPFANKGFESFINRLKNIEKITLTITTNGSYAPPQWFVDKISSFKEIVITLSIDATEELGEYIRSGLDWNIFEKNARLWTNLSQQFNNYTVKAHCSLSAYNIHAVIEIIEWSLLNNISRINFAKVYWPEPLQPQALPPDIKKDILDHYFGPLDKWSQVTRKIKTPFFMNEQYIRNILVDCLTSSDDPKLTKSFISYTNALDRLRQESILETNSFIKNSSIRKSFKG